jgi:hypothetical protein
LKRTTLYSLENKDSSLPIKKQNTAIDENSQHRLSDLDYWTDLSAMIQAGAVVSERHTIGFRLWLLLSLFGLSTAFLQCVQNTLGKGFMYLNQTSCAILRYQIVGFQAIAWRQASWKG